MAKWIEVSDETIKAFDDVLLNLLPERFGVNTKLMADNKQTKVIKLVKVPPLYKESYGDDLMITINEIIFERLPPVEQNLLIQEELGGVWFDAENDKLVVDKPDVVTYDGFIEKHGYEKHKVIRESIKTLYEVKKQEDAEAKANNKI